MPLAAAEALDVLPHVIVTPAPAAPRARPAKRLDLLGPLNVARLLSSSGALVQRLTSLGPEPPLRYHVTMASWSWH